MLEPTHYPTAGDLLDFVDESATAEALQLARNHLTVVSALVRSYTRGEGFDEMGFPHDDVAAVILTASARLMANPHQHKREELGGYSVTPTPFLGFSLAEMMVLNKYRKRTA